MTLGETPAAHLFWRVLAIGMCLLLAKPGVAGTVHGDLRKWQTLTIDFAGPTHSELDTGPNPFLDYRLQVQFTSPSAKVYSVPGYFDGNGSGGGTGNIWRVRFTPDESGTWQYQASFRSGSSVAISLNSNAGSATSFNGDSGNFSIQGADNNAPQFLRYGRLESVDQHYFKFRDGGYWIKSGINNPENFLGYRGFDNTPFAWHSYAPHVADWVSGDPDWNTPDTPTSNDGRGIIGALNYLASQKINSIYFLPMNIGADGMDTWPYASPTINRNGSTSNDNLHFDVSKLAQWETVLRHAQRKDIFLHFVLSDKTIANKRELDNATLGTERKLYYREIIARFGHHNALQWNICEEYNLDLPLSPDLIKEFAQYIGDVDPYNHPVTVHNHGNTYIEALTPFLGDDRFEVLSVQTWQQPDTIDGVVEHFRTESTDAGNAVPVMLDESIGMNQITAADYRKRIIWDALLSGGGFELFKSMGDSEIEDFRVYQEYMVFARHARSFAENNLPFWEMVPADHLVTGESTLHGGAEVFAKPGQTYAIYLPNASPAPTLTLNVNEPFEQRWYNPRTGQFQGTVTQFNGAGPTSVGLPPSDVQEDWVLLVQSLAVQNLPPTTLNQGVFTTPDAAASIDLSYTDVDGPGPYSFVVTQAPQHGSLTPINSDGSVIYTPNAGYEGSDSFVWRVNDGLVNSQTATVSIVIGSQVVLLNDNFSRPDSAVIGAGWVEVEETGAQVALVGGALEFIDTSDKVRRPLAQRTFARTTDGLLEWSFTFDWRRTGSEGTYLLYMQMGDGSAMQTTAVDPGVAVNLVWGNLGAHERLGYRQNGAVSPLTTLSGSAEVTVSVDLDAQTYTIAINGSTISAGIPFAQAVNGLDTIRFFTDGLNETSFTGRRFDDVVLQRLGGTSNIPPQANNQNVSTLANTAVAVELEASDADDDPLQFVVIDAPVNGTLQSNDGDSSLGYLPNPGFIGADSFSFVANDGTHNSNVAIVSISVNAGNIPPQANNQNVNTSAGTATPITLSYTDVDGPGPYSFVVTQAPQHGSLTPINSDGSVIYTPNAGYEGSDSFVWRVNDGLVNSQTATVSIVIGSQVVLLNDNFSRPDSAVIGAGWVEVEETGAQVALVGGALEFIDTSDKVRRPLAQRTFARTTDGLLEWSFTFDWRRTGSEGTYLLYMQMGDGSAMQTTAVDPGVAVNLVWGNLGAHERLGYRQNGAVSPLTTLSGSAEVTVSVDLDAQTYTIAINGSTISAGIPFAQAVNGLDTIRFFTDGLNETSFTGRRFDDVVLQRLGGTSNIPPQANNQNVNTSAGTATPITLSYTDVDGPGPYSFVVTQAPQHGSLTPINSDGSVIYTPNAGYEGSDSFVWRVNDGLVNSQTATVSIVIGSQVVLLNDNFSRPDSAVIGAGWVEVEETGAQVALVGGALEFIDTSDKVRRPLAQRTFARTTDGLLEWSFTFDWRRTGSEGTYLLYMQMGDGSAMQTTAVDPGVAVNLVWGNLGAHERLGYRQNGAVSPLTTLSGSAEVTVSVDLDAQTYTIAINGSTISAGIPFAQAVNGLDTIRFFTDGLNETSFTGRRFDTVRILDLN